MYHYQLLKCEYCAVVKLNIYCMWDLGSWFLILHHKSFESVLCTIYTTYPSEERTI